MSIKFFLKLFAAAAFAIIISSFAASAADCPSGWLPDTENRTPVCYCFVSDQLCQFGTALSRVPNCDQVAACRDDHNTDNPDVNDPDEDDGLPENPGDGSGDPADSPDNNDGINDDSPSGSQVVASLEESVYELLALCSCQEDTNEIKLKKCQAIAAHGKNFIRSTSKGLARSELIDESEAALMNELVKELKLMKRNCRPAKK